MINERVLQADVTHASISWMVDEQRATAVFLLALPGRYDLKGTIIRMLLSHRPRGPQEPMIGDTPLSFIEADMIEYALGEMGAIRALKLLEGLVVTGLNNARFRRATYRYIFDRDAAQIRRLCLRHRRRLRKILLHANPMTFYRRLYLGTCEPRWMRSQAAAKREALLFLFHGDMDRGILPGPRVSITDPALRAYLAAGRIVAKGDREPGRILELAETMDVPGFPREVAVGFFRALGWNPPRQFRTGITIKKLTLYRAYLRVFRQIERGDKDGWEDLVKHVEKLQMIKYDLRAGGVGVILDCAAKSTGRHTFITGMVVASLIDGVVSMAYAGARLVHGFGEGEIIAFPGHESEPAEKIESPVKVASQIPDAFEESKARGLQLLVLISDGEGINPVDVQAAWDDYRKENPSTKLLHIQPIAQGAPCEPCYLVDGVQPLMLTDPEYFRTALILRRVNDQPERLQEIMLTEYRKAVGKMRRELELVLA